MTQRPYLLFHSSENVMHKMMSVWAGHHWTLCLTDIVDQLDRMQPLVRGGRVATPTNSRRMTINGLTCLWLHYDGDSMPKKHYRSTTNLCIMHLNWKPLTLHKQHIFCIFHTERFVVYLVRLYTIVRKCDLYYRLNWCHLNHM